MARIADPIEIYEAAEADIESAQTLVILTVTEDGRLRMRYNNGFLRDFALMQAGLQNMVIEFMKGRTNEVVQ